VPPGTDELAIEIKASLSELTLPGPLLKRSSGGVTDGSGGPLHRETHCFGSSVLLQAGSPFREAGAVLARFIAA
jgi:hypothetical protein